MAGNILKTIEDTYRCFNHAALDDVSVGPRREASLIVRPLLWQGQQAHHGAALAIRFGGLEDFETVARQFEALLRLESEIGFLGPEAGAKSSNHGAYRFKFESERSDLEFSFSCKSVTIDESPKTG